MEEGWIGRPETNMILKKYLRRIKSKNVDTLILGCTHYPFLQKDIERIMGKNCRVLNGPDIVAEKLADYLSRHPEIEERLPQGGEVLYCTTDDTGIFRSLGEKFLGRKIDHVDRVMLG